VIRRKYYNGILLGLTLLLLISGVRGYYPRYYEPLQEHSQPARQVISEGDYPELLIISKGAGNPDGTLKQPPVPGERPLTSGMSDAVPSAELREEVKLVAVRDFSGSVYLDITAVDLIFPFHDFL
jgi:hypothetical protein